MNYKISASGEKEINSYLSDGWRVVNRIRDMGNDLMILEKKVQNEWKEIQINLKLHRYNLTP